jgi:hypothetical protein
LTAFLFGYRVSPIARTGTPVPGLFFPPFRLFTFD